MEKLLAFLLISSLCLNGTLQTRDKNKKKHHNENLNVPVPRIFPGDPVTEKNPFQNGTLPPKSLDSSPELNLQGNTSARYIRGLLSTRVIPVIYILVLSVGIPANLVILGTLGTKVRKVSSAILYCSLAVSDLFLLFSLFFKAHYHLHGNHWLFGEPACRLVTACFYGNLYCSAQTLACISIKRYLAVAYPFMYKSLPKRMYTSLVCVVVWGVFGAAVIPELLIQQTYWIPQLQILTCHDVLPVHYESHSFLLYYNLTLTILGLLLPLVVTIVCYVRIMYELNQAHSDWALYMKASSLVFVIFLVCFAPAGVLHFLHYVNLSVNGTVILYVYFNVAVCLCCLHSCLDPFLFLLMSKSTGSSHYLRTFKGKTLSLSI